MIDKIEPQVGDYYHDDFGRMVCVAIAVNYAVVRRKGCIPFVMTFAEWERKRKASKQFGYDAKAVDEVSARLQVEATSDATVRKIKK